MDVAVRSPPMVKKYFANSIRCLNPTYEGPRKIFRLALRYILLNILYKQQQQRSIFDS